MQNRNHQRAAPAVNPQGLLLFIRMDASEEPNAIQVDKFRTCTRQGKDAVVVVKRAMNRQGTMVLRNANEVVSEVFEITGFMNILTLA